VLQQNRERYAFPNASGRETAAGTGMNGRIGPTWCQDESAEKLGPVLGELPLPMPVPARAACADIHAASGRRSQTPCNGDGLSAWHPGILSYAEAELVAIDAQLRRIEQLRAAIDAFQDQEGVHGKKVPRGPLPRLVEDSPRDTGTATSSAGVTKVSSARGTGRRHYWEHKMTKDADFAEDTDATTSPRFLGEIASNRLASSLNPRCQQQQQQLQQQGKKKMQMQMPLPNRKQHHRLQQLLRDACCGWHWRSSKETRLRRPASLPTCFTALLGS